MYEFVLSSYICPNNVDITKLFAPEKCLIRHKAIRVEVTRNNDKLGIFDNMQAVATMLDLTVYKIKKYSESGLFIDAFKNVWKFKFLKD